jgi:hypothetical protein
MIIACTHAYEEEEDTCHGQDYMINLHVHMHMRRRRIHVMVKII